MAKLRNVQFLRNATVVTVAAEGKSIRQTAIDLIKEQVGNLNDGEFILGRYQDGTEVKSVLGVAYVNGDTKQLTIIPDDQVDSLIASLDGSATIASVSNGVVTIKAGVVETDGKIANNTDADITLKKVATTAEAEDVFKTTNSTAVYNTTATEISDTWKGVVNGNKLEDGDSVDVDLNRLDNKIAGLADELIADEEVIKNSFAAVQASVGLKDDMTLDLTGTNYIDDDTNVKAALTTLDDEIKSINDEIDAMDLGESSIVTLNGADVQAKTIKEEDGQVTVQNATTVFSFNQALTAENKAATMADISASELTVEGSNAIAVSAKANNKQTVSLTINTNDKVLTQSADGLLANLTMTYGDVTEGEGETARTYKAIQLKGKENTVISTIDATDFIKDGMLQDAEVVTNPEGQAAGTYLKLTFNTDAGSRVVYVNVTSLIDVYTADETYLHMNDHKVEHKTSGVTANSYGESTTATKDYAGTINVPRITVDAAGHITAASDSVITLPSKQTASDALTIAVDNNVATISDTLTVDGTAQTASSVKLKAENGLKITADGSDTAVIAHNTQYSGTTAIDTIAFADNELSKTLSVPVLTIDTYGHVTANAQTTYTITLPGSIATAVQTVQGKADKDQRDNLNNLEYVNVKATKTGTTVELESSVQVQSVATATAGGEVWTEVVAHTFTAETAIDGTVAIAQRGGVTDQGTWNTVTVNGYTYYIIENAEQRTAILTSLQGATFEGADKTTATAAQGLAEASDVKNYVDSHEPQVAGSSNVTVTTSMNGTHKVYTVSVADAQTTTVSSTASDAIKVTESTTATGKNYDVTLELADKAHVGDTTAVSTVDGATNLLKVDADGKLSMSDTWDCGTF